MCFDGVYRSCLRRTDSHTLSQNSRQPHSDLKPAEKCALAPVKGAKTASYGREVASGTSIIGTLTRWSNTVCRPLSPHHAPLHSRGFFPDRKRQRPGARGV